MKSFYAWLALAIGGNVLYHFAQKSVTKSVNPLHALAAAYALALIMCVVAALATRSEQSFIGSLREMNWAVWMVGAAAFMIELGVLLAYRSGGRVGLLGVTVAVATNLILLPVGFVVFREQLSKWNMLGIVLSIVGLVLVTKK